MPVSIQVEAPGDALPELHNRIAIALDEAADVIAKLPVPFLPLVLPEAAYLVQAAFIPCFRNQLGARQTGSESISQRMGGFAIGSPDSLREKTEARSKRKPSTCISETHT